MPKFEAGVFNLTPKLVTLKINYGKRSKTYLIPSELAKSIEKDIKSQDMYVVSRVVEPAESESSR